MKAICEFIEDLKSNPEHYTLDKIIENLTEIDTMVDAEINLFENKCDLLVHKIIWED